MLHTYHIRIKKDYAAAIIEDLQKLDAIEFMREENPTELEESQRNEIRRRIVKYQNSPELLIDEDTFFKMLDAD